MAPHSPGALLQALRSRGVHGIGEVRVKSNRVRILSLSRDRRTLHLHHGFLGAGPEILDAIATFLRAERGSAAMRRAVAVLRDFAAGWTAGAAAAARPPRPGPCCGTPAQRRFLCELYRRHNRACFDGRLPAELPLRFSNRMRRRFGHVRFHRDREGRRGVVELALNVDLLLEGNERQLLDTLLHEMAHVEAWLFQGHRGHGEAWKRIARRIGCEARACTRAPIARRGAGRGATTRVPPVPAGG